MKIRHLPVLAIAALVATTACKKNESGGDETTQKDSAVVPGTDTINQPTVVPTQDTVVKTTTTTTDTVHGQAGDSAATVTAPAAGTDTTKRP